MSGDGGWGPSPSMSAGLFGMGGRREHAGAWLLCDAIKSLLGALVAMPGHPDLGPFYLLRGLLKAVRRRVCALLTFNAALRRIIWRVLVVWLASVPAC